MARRRYSATARSTTLAAACTSTATSISVNSLPGTWPSVPFTIAIERGGTDEEICLVTAVSGTGPYALTVTRGYDGTQNISHEPEALVEHAVSAIDYDEANDHISKTSGVHGVTGSVVGTGGAQTLSGKTLVAPVIDDFSGAGHNHSTPAEGGPLDLSAAQHDHSSPAEGGAVLVDHGATSGLGDDDHPQYARDSQGTWAARPAAGRVGRYYYATDVNGGTLFRDTGSTWRQVGVYDGLRHFSATRSANVSFSASPTWQIATSLTIVGAPAGVYLAIGNPIVSMTVVGTQSVGFRRITANGSNVTGEIRHDLVNWSPLPSTIAAVWSHAGGDLTVIDYVRQDQKGFTVFAPSRLSVAFLD